MVLQLAYFDVMARGLQPALLLELSGLEWERVPLHSQIKELKQDMDKCPFGQLPLLMDTEVPEVGTIAQSLAIANYIGAKAGMNGDGSVTDKVISDTLYNETEDLFKLFGPGVPSIFAKLGTGMKKGYDHWLIVSEEKIPKQLEYLEALLNSRGKNGKFSGSGRTVGEIYLCGFLYQLCLVLPKALDTDTPALKVFYQDFIQDPKVKLVLEGNSKFGAFKQYFVNPGPEGEQDTKKQKTG